MITFDTGALIALAVWFVLVVGTVLPLVALVADILVNGRPPVVDENANRPEVTVAPA